MLRFAVAGSPLSTPPPGGTVEGIRRAAALGLDAMEIEWVRNVPQNRERMAEIRHTAEELGMILTAHAPYYVNLNAREKEKLAASVKRVTDALAMAEIAGARSVCVHPAFYLGMDPPAAYANVRKATDGIMKLKNKLFPDVNLAFETMGKTAQFGTIEEVLKLSREFDIYPCVDLAHMHARANGGYNTEEAFRDVLDMYADHLGKKSLGTMHLHYSGIAYTAKGERKHVPLRESDARWKDCLRVLKERHAGGVLVCESPALEEDTLLLQRTYATLK